MDENNYCVYMHITPNNKKYIGITNNTKRRWMNNGKEYEKCTSFFNAILKFGWDNIEHIIIETNLSLEKAEDKEKEYIEYYKTINPIYGYNLTAGGRDGTRIKRKIIQYDNNGKQIGTFNSQIECSKITGINQTIISRICLHKQRNDINGCVYRYEGDPFDINNCDTPPINHTPIYSMDFNKKIIKKYNSVTDAARDNNVNYSSITAALDVPTRKCANKYWCSVDNFKNFFPTEYKKNRRKIRAINKLDLDGNIIETYKSSRQAGEENGLSHSSILECCKGKKLTYGGFKWEFTTQ